jgi:hypothetical protein
MRLEIKNVKKIEAVHSHLPALKLVMMSDGMYEFNSYWDDMAWLIQLGRMPNLNGRYPLTVRSAQAFFSTTECSTAMLRDENFLRFSVMKMMKELNKTPV